MEAPRFERLLEAKERKDRLHKAERKQEELARRLLEQERLIGQLERKLGEEQEDVEQLTKMSLVNLFHTILRSKEEQLELERQQALAAALKLGEAKQALADMEAERFRLGELLAELAGAEADYERLMAEKEAALRGSPADSAELEEMEAQIADQTALLRDIDEARSAGRSVLASLEDASDCLEKAESWGKWDMWTKGGVLATYQKHERIDEAKRFIQQANRQMQRFRDELADLKRSVEIEVNIGDMMRLADYWIDSLITDWIVQKRIHSAQEQTLDALRQVRDLVRRLEQEHGSASSALADLKARRIAWIENR